MQPSATIRRFMSRRLYLWVLTCVVLFSGAGLATLRSPAAHAASTSTDPLVVVAVDQTSTTCVSRTTWSKGSTIIYSSTDSCLPGTVMAALPIHRSQAMLENQPFVVLPPSNATPADWQQFYSQVDLLVFKQRQSLRQHAQTNAALLLQPAETHADLMPNGSCGYGVDRFYSTIVDGDNLWSNLYYYENNDCTDVNLESTDSTLNGPYYNPLWWHDFDDWDYFCCGHEEWPTSPYCPSVAPPNHTYSLGLGDENENNGNDVTNEYITEAGCSSGYVYYLDFGNL